MNTLIRLLFPVIFVTMYFGFAAMAIVDHPEIFITPDHQKLTSLGVLPIFGGMACVMLYIWYYFSAGEYYLRKNAWALSTDYLEEGFYHAQACDACGNSYVLIRLWPATLNLNTMEAKWGTTSYCYAIHGDSLGDGFSQVVSALKQRKNGEMVPMPEGSFFVNWLRGSDGKMKLTIHPADGKILSLSGSSGARVTHQPAFT